MSAAAKQILEAALKLDPAERVHVAEQIWESVKAEPTETVEQLWRAELAIASPSTPTAAPWFEEPPRCLLTSG